MTAFHRLLVFFCFAISIEGRELHSSPARAKHRPRRPRKPGLGHAVGNLPSCTLSTCAQSMRWQQVHTRPISGSCTTTGGECRRGHHLPTRPTPPVRRRGLLRPKAPPTGSGHGAQLPGQPATRQANITTSGPYPHDGAWQLLLWEDASPLQAQDGKQEAEVRLPT